MAAVVRFHSRSAGHRPRLSPVGRPLLRLLRFGLCTLLCFTGSRPTAVAAACRHAQATDCDRWWLACAATDWLARLAIRCARVGSAGLRRYDSSCHHSWRMVLRSEGKDPCLTSLSRHLSAIKDPQAPWPAFPFIKRSCRATRLAKPNEERAAMHENDFRKSVLRKEYFRQKTGQIV